MRATGRLWIAICALIVIAGAAGAVPTVDGDAPKTHTCGGAGAGPADVDTCDFDDDGVPDYVNADVDPSVGPADVYGDATVFRVTWGSFSYTGATGGLVVYTPVTGAAGAGAGFLCLNFDADALCDYGIAGAFGGTGYSSPAGSNYAGAAVYCWDFDSGNDACRDLLAAVVFADSDAIGLDQGAAVGVFDQDEAVVCTGGNLVDEGCTTQSLP